MIRRYAVGAVVLHALYAGAWLLLDDHGRDMVERWVTLAAIVIAGLFYVGMAVAFLWARKSRLNLAFSVQKVYWSLLIWLLVVPSAAGVAFRHAPYARVRNPYAYWIAPGWLRTYVWVGLSVATAGVAYEFLRANALWPFRRDRPDAPDGSDELVSIAPERSRMEVV